MMKDEPDIRMGIWFDLKPCEEDSMTKDEWDSFLWDVQRDVVRYIKQNYDHLLKDIDGELDMNLEELLENK